MVVVLFVVNNEVKVGDIVNELVPNEFEIEVADNILEVLVFVFLGVFTNETELITDVKEVELVFSTLKTLVE